MSTALSKAHFASKNLQNEKIKARLELEARKADTKAKIESLKQELRDMDFAFDQYWDAEKSKRQSLVDELAMAELVKGTKATAILKLLESRNTVWIYTLKKKVDDGHVVEAPEEEPSVPEGNWLYHDFKATHSYAFSEDFSQVKKHGVIDTPDEGLYFVANYTANFGNRELEFAYGDREFFDKQSKSELLKRTKQLDEILNDVYAGKIVLAENPYKNL